MIEKKRLELLQEQIEFYKSLYKDKRNRNKWISFGLKIGSAVSAASISVLLGLSSHFLDKDLAKNISLVLGAVITVFNMWEAFFNHKALYIRATTSMVACCLLKDEVDFLATKSIDTIKEEEIAQFHENLMAIVKDNNNLWQELKKENYKPTM